MTREVVLPQPRRDDLLVPRGKVVEGDRAKTGTVMVPRMPLLPRTGEILENQAGFGAVIMAANGTDSMNGGPRHRRTHRGRGIELGKPGRVSNFVIH